MDPQTQIQDLLAPILKDLGFDLVRVMLTSTTTPTLQIMVERPNYGGLTMAELEEITPVISAALDVADPLDRRYNLEVSSPGIDRPLLKLMDYAQYRGHEARLELSEAIEGRRRYHGILDGLQPDTDPPAILIQVAETGQHAIPFERIRKARLILTDHLIKTEGERMRRMRPAAGPDPALVPILDAAEDEDGDGMGGPGSGPGTL